MTDAGNGIYNATFIPDDCGRYKIDVKYAGKNLPMSPIPIQVYAIGNVSKNNIKQQKYFYIQS